MTFESGLTAFTVLVLIVIIALVGHATFRPASSAGRWHRPVGIGIMALLSVLAAAFAWWGIGGGK